MGASVTITQPYKKTISRHFKRGIIFIEHFWYIMLFSFFTIMNPIVYPVLHNLGATLDDFTCNQKQKITGTSQK